MNINPETLPVIMGHEPATCAAIADTSDYICLKNCQGVLITAIFTYAEDEDWTLTVHEAATATGTSALATAFQIWVNAAPATSDAMVRQTDAVTYVVDGTPGTDHVVQFYVDASILTATYDWIQLGTAVTGGTSNLGSVMYQLVGARYQQETPPTAIA